MKNNAIVLAAILTATWPNGTITHDPATDMETCRFAAEAWLVGRGLPLNAVGPATSVSCVPSDPFSAGFKPGWDCIEGYNCKGK